MLKPNPMIKIFTDCPADARQLEKGISRFGVTTDVAREIDSNPAPLNLLFKYSKILTPREISYFDGKLILNLHNSLLPLYKGLHAFSWAIENDEKELGYSLHVVSPRIDSGSVLGRIGFYLNSECDINCAFRIGDILLLEWLPIMLMTIIENSDNFRPKDFSEEVTSQIFRRRQGPYILDQPVGSTRLFNALRASNPPYGKGLVFKPYSESAILVSTSSPESRAFLSKIASAKLVKVKTQDGEIECFSISDTISS